MTPINIPIKSSRELMIMCQAGKILRLIFSEIENLIQSGQSGMAIENLAARLIRQKKAQPAFLGYKKYPAVSCININHQIVHCPPTDKEFKNGDIVSVDIGIIFEGLYVDKARTFAVGKINREKKQLIKASRQALKAGINQAKEGHRLLDIQIAIQNTIQSFGFGIVKEFSGHGIGRQLHEPPSIFNFQTPGESPILALGMCLALEPMITAGQPEIEISSLDGWGASTKDKKPAAHIEDTVEVGKTTGRVLT